MSNIYFSATLFTKNPTWTSIESNPNLRDDSSATNTLSYGKFRQVVKMLRRNFLPPSLRRVLKMEEVLSATLVLTTTRWNIVNANVDYGSPTRGPPACVMRPGASLANYTYYKNGTII